MNKKISLDELLTKRQGHVKSTARGDAIVKAASKAPGSWDSDNRTARFIMTTESIDRYGDIVVQSGGDLERFMKNPQALMFHNSRDWPIGTWSDVTKILSGRPKRTEGVLNFMEEGMDEDADRAARHVSAGTIRTISIGFIPLDWEWLTDQEGDFSGIKFTAWELIEASLVPIPANPECLVKDAGGDMRIAKALIEEVLDTYSRTPEGLLIPRKEYEEAYSVVKVAEGTRKSATVGDGALRKSGGLVVGGLKISVEADESSTYDEIAERARSAVETALLGAIKSHIKAPDEGIGLRAAEPDMEPEEEGCKPKKDGGCGDEDEPEVAAEAAEEAMPEDEKKHVGGLVDGFVKSLAAFFKRKHIDPEEIKADTISATKTLAEAPAPEPEEKAAEPAPPTPEEIMETIEAAAAVRARLLASGLIKAA